MRGKKLIRELPTSLRAVIDYDLGSVLVYDPYDPGYDEIHLNIVDIVVLYEAMKMDLKED